MLASQGVLQRYTCPKKVVTACTQAETQEWKLIFWYYVMIHEVLPLEPRKIKDVCEQVGHATLITLSNVSYTLIITAFAVGFPRLKLVVQKQFYVLDDCLL